MCPEYGATSAYFPVDEQTLAYLRFTGRGDRGRPRRALHEGAGAVPARRRRPSRCSPRCSSSTCRRSSRRVAGPKRPQDRVPLPRRVGLVRRGVPRPREPDPKADRGRAGSSPRAAARQDVRGPRRRRRPDARPGGEPNGMVRNGSVVIAAITSCTNTSNPSVMLAAGLLAKRAVEAGLDVEAVGQDVARARLARGDRLPRPRGAHAVPRQARVRARRLRLHDLHRQLRARCSTRSPRRSTRATSTSSPCSPGNRNFEGRVHPQVRASYLASPPLVVAYALAGRIDIDLTTDPLGEGADGPVFLRDLWPSPDEVARRRSRSAITRGAVRPSEYAADLGGRRALARAPDTPTGPGLRVGPGIDLRAGAALLRATSRRGRSATSRARACW